MSWSERTVVRDGVRLVCRDWGAAVSLPGTGHDLHLERAGALHALISGFLDGIDRRGRQAGPAEGTG
ncbi:hypothetical protein OG322_23910 [Streptomyces sp. NBC_01260]|uniref:hypothetical protein n=1 Tax=Streptomyces sp. NBC_01260 TaxID=2903801 RepID=UPI002E3684BF|nr:hypothetical protein [Streptomyces sp. NBC_01260]